MTTPFTIWAAEDYELAEGSRWVDGRLVYVDILTGRLLAAPAARNAQQLARLDVPLGAAAPIAGSPGAWIVAAGTGIAILDAAGVLTWLDRPEDAATTPARMNDAVCDPHGRFWAGSMAYAETPGAGSLYRVGPGGSVERVLDGMTIVNGPAFTVDGSTMYVTDTAAGVVYRCTVDPRGEIADRETFLEIPPEHGSPDGMTIDDEGRLWIAMWGGSSVRCYDADGSPHRVIDVPAQRPTSVCLADGRIFVTTARHGQVDDPPESGAVLVAAIDATAPPASAFRISSDARPAANGG